MEGINIHLESIERMNNFSVPDKLSFGKIIVPIMVECDYADEKWGEVNLVPYQDLKMDPCAKVLHYGQEIFEGLKAYKTPKNTVNLFRPEKNANRFNYSARRMAMPEFPADLFVNSCEAIASLSKQFIPNEMGSSLYIRPFMIATQVALGIGPSENFKFLVVASPSGSYFKGGTVKVLVETTAARATPGGTGSAKAGGNYAGGLLAAKKMMGLGYHQTLWLDAIEKKYIEELSGMNFFAVINGELHTPKLTDTILKGITRGSILEIAQQIGIKTHTRKIEISELLEQIKSKECTEVFACGTAAIITPVELLGFETGEIYNLSEPNGSLTNILRKKLLSIQSGIEPGPEGWIREVRSI